MGAGTSCRDACAWGVMGGRRWHLEDRATAERTPRLLSQHLVLESSSTARTCVGEANRELPLRDLLTCVHQAHREHLLGDIVVALLGCLRPCSGDPSGRLDGRQDGHVEEKLLQIGALQRAFVQALREAAQVERVTWRDKGRGDGRWRMSEAGGTERAGTWRQVVGYLGGSARKGVGGVRRREGAERGDKLPSDQEVRHQSLRFSSSVPVPVPPFLAQAPTTCC